MGLGCERLRERDRSILSVILAITWSFQVATVATILIYGAGVAAFGWAVARYARST